MAFRKLQINLTKNRYLPMKHPQILLAAYLLLFASALKAGNEIGTSAKATAKKVTVYTTAENTRFRLTQTETVSFVDFGQP